MLNLLIWSTRHFDDPLLYRMLDVFNCEIVLCARGVEGYLKEQGELTPEILN